MAAGVELTNAPPRVVDFDWKHIIHQLTADFGLPGEIIWIIAGFVSFLIARVWLKEQVKAVWNDAESLKLIVETAEEMELQQHPCRLWARILLPSLKRPACIRVVAQLLSIGTGLARLIKYEHTFFATSYGAVLPFVAGVVWACIYYVIGSNLHFSAIVIAFAWLPTSTLVVFYWWYAGELSRRRQNAERELTMLESNH